MLNARVYAVATCIFCLLVGVWILIIRDTIAYDSKRLIDIYCLDWSMYSSQKIPRVVCQTYHNWHKVPLHVHQQFAHLAQGFERRFFTDFDARQYIRTHYPASVQKAYSKLRGAHRADLFRYCYLYREGGVYMDIKTVLHANLEDIVSIVEAHNCKIATCLTEPVVLPSLKAQVYQGFIIARPRCILFLECIEYAVTYSWRTRIEYLNFVRNMSLRLLSVNSYELKPGVSRNGETYFFREIVSYLRCDGNLGVKDPLLKRSRKTLNCSVIATPEGETILGTRYADYPW